MSFYLIFDINQRSMRSRFTHHIDINNNRIERISKFLRYIKIVVQKIKRFQCNMKNSKLFLYRVDSNERTDEKLNERNLTRHSFYNNKRNNVVLSESFLLY